jgi:hypothetical protein
MMMMMIIMVMVLGSRDKLDVPGLGRDFIAASAFVLLKMKQQLSTQPPLAQQQQQQQRINLHVLLTTLEKVRRLPGPVSGVAWAYEASW